MCLQDVMPPYSVQICKTIGPLKCVLFVYFKLKDFERACYPLCVCDRILIWTGLIDNP